MTKELGRALRLRCPNCGRDGQLKSWLKVKPHCESCGLRFDRGEHDYFIGAYTLNLIVSELIVVTVFVAAIFMTYPDVPWTALMWGLVPLAVVAPAAMLPLARSVWLALDIRLRHLEPSDFAFEPGSISSG
jgi:uncharacterized protein (DUF983 family)